MVEGAQRMGRGWGHWKEKGRRRRRASFRKVGRRREEEAAPSGLGGMAESGEVWVEGGV